MADGHGKDTRLIDIAAERAVLASMMLDNDTIAVIAAKVAPRDFYEPRHSVIFEGIVAVRARREPVDILTLTAELRDRERLNAVGGAQYLGEITDFIPTTAHCETHASIVADLAGRRRILAVGPELIAKSRELKADELLALAAKLLRDVAPEGDAKLQTASQVAATLYAQHAVPREPDAPCISLPTGFDELDAAFSLDPGRLYIFAARPAMGKSALTGQIAHHAANLKRGRVIFFSLEMKASEVAHREVAGSAGLDVREMEHGLEIGDEYAREIAQGKIVSYVERLNTFDGLDIIYCDTPSVSVDRVEAVCQREALSGPVALVVIDYLQLMRVEEAERHDLAIGNVTRRMKALAMSLGCPVIVVSQLNRELERRPNKRPTLADLRDSGNIEQDADGVVMIYRDEVYHRDSKDKGIAEIIVAKQRNGPPGMVRMKWRAEQVRFEELGDDSESYRVAGWKPGAGAARRGE